MAEYIRTKLSRWRVWVSLAVIVFSAVVCPVSVIAQTGGGITSSGGTTSVGGDAYFTPGAGGSSAGPTTIITTFQNATAGWLTAMTPIATSLFWALAGIDFTWTCISLVLQHDDLKSWMGGFIRKILTIGFFAALLTNGATWIADIVNFFISIGGTVGGTNIANLNASSIMGTGIVIAGDMLTGGKGAPSTGASIMSLFTNPVGNIAIGLLMVLGAFLIVVCYVIIALHFVMAMVEAYITIGAGYIFLGFGGSRWTVPYTEKYLGMVVSAGVRIMVLEMMIGLGKPLAATWQTMAVTVARTPSLLTFPGIAAGASASTSWQGVQLLFALISSIAIFALCCWTIPSIAANVASGGLSMSGGDVVGSAAAAATAMFATNSLMSNNSGGNKGSEVASVAQAAAMKGAEMGTQLAMAAATGGASAAAGAGAEAATASVEAASSAAAESGAAAAGAGEVGMTPEPPDSGGDGGGGDEPGQGSGQGGEAQGSSSGASTEGEGAGSASGASASEASAVNQADAPATAPDGATGGGDSITQSGDIGSTPQAPGADGGSSEQSSSSSGSSTVAGQGTATSGQGDSAAQVAEGGSTPQAPGADGGSSEQSSSSSGSSSVAGQGTATSGQGDSAAQIAEGGSTPQAPGSEASKPQNTASNMYQTAQNIERGLNSLPEHAGHMGGVTPVVNHGE
jgi:type IV secretion system protein TrbL